MHVYSWCRLSPTDHAHLQNVQLHIYGGKAQQCGLVPFFCHARYHQDLHMLAVMCHHPLLTTRALYHSHHKCCFCKDRSVTAAAWPRLLRASCTLLTCAWWNGRYRVANLVMRIYRRSRAWALAFFAISIALIFYVRLNSCAAYIETFFGLAPINFILTGLALTGAFLAMPIRPGMRPEALQVHCCVVQKSFHSDMQACRNP